MIEKTHKIPHCQAHKLFSKLAPHYQHKFIFESKDVSHIYGRLSLIGIDPVLQITGKANHFEVKKLNSRGQKFLDQIQLPENDNQPSAEIIRLFLKQFHTEKHTMLGLYGAFSYDFVRQFEKLNSTLPENEIPDFNLFLYDTFIFFDHLKETSEIILYRETEEEITDTVDQLTAQIAQDPQAHEEYRITNADFQMNQQEYEGLVEKAREYCAQGEIFEVVFSNVLEADFGGDPYSLYLKYREINPSPYLYFFDFGEDQLVGASPEMMVRCENRQVHLRPISGTARRGQDPIEDHENMLALLADEKERSELDMLIDLGRNDLSRICKPKIKISDYRFVEKYSQVMHTVAHLTGELQDDKTAFDALIATLNAGTLTGAPKIAAMNIIETHESSRRGYYGGTIGYLTFSGNMDTGIIIRTAHITGTRLRFQVGATLLYDSNPAAEYRETIGKAQAFLNTFAS